MTDASRLETLKRVMAERNINAHALAKKAKVQPSTLYNFMSGVSKNLSVSVIKKIAEALDTSVDRLLGHEPAATGGEVSVPWEVGVLGKLYEIGSPLIIARPVWVDQAEDIVAAQALGEVLRPMPGEWTVFFRRETENPEALVGKLCIVRVAQSAHPMIREIRRGSQRGLYHLNFWAAPPIEDADLVAAHLIVAMTQR